MEFSSPVRRHFSSTICKDAGTSDKIHRHPVRIGQVHLRARHKPIQNVQLHLIVSLHRKACHYFMRQNKRLPDHNDALLHS